MHRAQMRWAASMQATANSGSYRSDSSHRHSRGQPLLAPLAPAPPRAPPASTCRSRCTCSCHCTRRSNSSVRDSNRLCQKHSEEIGTDEMDNSRSSPHEQQLLHQPPPFRQQSPVQPHSTDASENAEHVAPTVQTAVVIAQRCRCLLAKGLRRTHSGKGEHGNDHSGLH
jgi:hypothetical protein